jgi:CTD small phosphatase-like protein 2
MQKTSETQRNISRSVSTVNLIIPNLKPQQSLFQINKNLQSFNFRSTLKPNKLPLLKLAPKEAPKVLEKDLNWMLKRLIQFTKPSASNIREANALMSYIAINEIPLGKELKLVKPKGYENKKTLILDLDETLIHTSEKGPGTRISINASNDSMVYFNIRPYTYELLKYASQEYEVIVFTASRQLYADAILNYIDPLNQYIHHRLYRSSCTIVNYNYIKDISLISDRNLKDIIIVDNCIGSFIKQIDNGVPISSWYDNPNDFQLKILKDYLKLLRDVPDVRTINRFMFNIKVYILNAN